MQLLLRQIIRFFEKQGFVIISTIGADGSINASAKGIVNIEARGRIFLLDLYKGKTFRNLKKNSHVSITAVDEHAFEGYTLKGHAKIIEKNKFGDHIIKAWEDKIVSRVTERVLKNVKGEKRPAGRHPEVRMPQPKYLIEVDVKEIVDLTPQALKE